MVRLFDSNGVNTDLEMALFNIDHGINVRKALVRTRAEYEVRKGVQAADALAWALYANGRYEAARRLSREALRLGTNSALFHYHAGMIEYRLGHEDAAVRHLERALALNPHFSFLHGVDAVRTLRRLRRGSG